MCVRRCFQTPAGPFLRCTSNRPIFNCYFLGQSFLAKRGRRAADTSAGGRKTYIAVSESVVTSGWPTCARCLESALAIDRLAALYHDAIIAQQSPGSASAPPYIFRRQVSVLCVVVALCAEYIYRHHDVNITCGDPALPFINITQLYKQQHHPASAQSSSSFPCC